MWCLLIKIPDQLKMFCVASRHNNAHREKDIQFLHNYVACFSRCNHHWAKFVQKCKKDGAH